MSSKDVIVADIIRVVEEQQRENPTKYFYHYTFQGIKSFHGIKSILHLEFGFKLNSDKPDNCRILLKIIHPDMDDYSKQVDVLYSKIIRQCPKFDEENVSLALDEIKQTLNYLAASQNKLGLLVNFGEDSLKYKRIIL